MKTKTTITELTHDDLVELFSTALTGSSYLGADYEESIEYNEDACFEDILANILLHEGSIKITDYYAEGEVHGSLPHEIDEDEIDEDENVTYLVTYDDIKKGLERAADGTFNAGNDKYRANELAFARKAYDAFVNYDDCGFDLVYADALMQIILFDEIIYG
jgi:hypothetical protein